MPVPTPEQYLAMLDAASEQGYAYAAVNVSSSQTLNAALRGFAAAGADGIVQVTTGGASYKALDAAELPRMRFHDLRHTFGTLAVQAFPLTDVKAFMGHADIQTTMIYAHHVPQHDAADRLTALLEKQTRRTVDAQSELDEAAESRKPLDSGENECRRRDSNPRHADYDSAALTS
jgi:fructose/tagatose bisphosphate aldolase